MAHECEQSFRSLETAILHENAEQIATEGVRDVVILDGVATGARPACTKEGKRSHPHADTT
jgi:hypothetical protein